MAYHHVLLRLAGAANADRCVLSDLSERELRQRFLRPYQRGKSLLCGSEVIDLKRISAVSIIRTGRPMAESLQRIQEDSQRRIDESAAKNYASGVVIIELPSGYTEEDIVQTGENVTPHYIKGAPGGGDLWTALSGLGRWVSGIIAAVIAGLLLWWFGAPS